MKKQPLTTGSVTASVSRRRFIVTSTGALAGATLSAGLTALRAVDPASGKWQIPDRSGTAPSSPVALLRCESYDPTVFRQALAKAFDLLGGIKTLLQNKTVAVKLNLTGLTWNPVFGLPAHETYQTQPNTVAALCALLVEAGVRRIVLLENLYWEKPFEQVLAEEGWDVKAIHTAGEHKVRFEDTRNRGQILGYSRLKVPWGGYMYPAFDFNERFEKCDVFISLREYADVALRRYRAGRKRVDPSR